MNEDLEKMWEKLSLTEVKQVEMVVEKDWLEEVREAGKHCLIGRLVLNKRVNLEAMKNVLSMVWKLCARMTIKEVGNRVFIFHFEDIGEKENVLLRQPWFFNKSLLVLENYDDHSKPEDFKLHWCPFWVQIHGLPLGMMIEKIGLILGESIGDVEELDVDNDKLVWGKYLRVRVLLNITHPLKKGSKVAIF